RHVSSLLFGVSSFPSLSLLLRDRDLARRFFLRQGLWTEGLQTPPGQECSNGSLTFFAVVLWRTFFAMKLLKVKTGRFSEIVEKAGRPRILHALAKAIG